MPLKAIRQLSDTLRSTVTGRIKMRTSFVPIAFSFMGLAAISCRNPPQASRLETLDNVGSRSLTFEACQGKGPTHPRAALSGEPHLQQALAAVPYKIQKDFFEDLGGRIRISASDECNANSSRQDDSLGCWRRLPSKDQSMEIVIRRSSKAKEQYALVRTFGFVYGDILLSRVVPNELSEPVQVASRPGGSFAGYKNHLASLFIGELYASSDDKEKKGVRDILSDLGISADITTEKDFEKRWQKFNRLPTDLKDAFSSRIFAEAFHSQFCSKKSAETACRRFPMTLASFKPYADDVADRTGATELGCGSVNSAKVSATHLGWHRLNQGKISQRDVRAADKGSYANAKIAQAVGQRASSTKHSSFSLSNNQPELSLNGDMLQQLMGLVTGGISGDGGGLGGILGQLFGNLGGDGGHVGLGNLSGLLASLGLGDILSNVGDMENNDGGNNLPDILPNNNNNDPLPSGGNATAEEQAGMDATNRYRQSKGKSVLQVDQQMVEDCRKQAQLQAQRGGLTHWLHPAGVARAENIAYGSKSGEYTVMQQWVKSPGHHANIMGGHRFIGIGSYGNQWCQRFR